MLSAILEEYVTELVDRLIYLIILNYFMAYRVYLSDYLPLDIGTTAAYLSTGANQFALKILKLFILINNNFFVWKLTIIYKLLQES